MTPHPERKTMRLASYDYSLPGAYFVTACTKNRELFFDALDAKLAVELAWHSLLDIFANIELGQLVVMSDHIHCIVWIMEEGSYRLHPGTMSGRPSIQIPNLRPSVTSSVPSKQLRQRG
jgi:REP-associated tyrosine transposase